MADGPVGMASSWLGQCFSVGLLLLLVLHVKDVACTSYSTWESEDYIAGNLTCHYCYRSAHGENCVTLRHMAAIRRQRCHIEEQFCQVERYMTNGNLTTFVRQCAKTCEPGCVEVGRLYTVQTCTSCCDSHLCNTQNSAINLQTSTAAGLMSTLLSAISLLRNGHQRL